MEVDSERETATAASDKEPAQQVEDMDVDGAPAKPSSGFIKKVRKGKGVTKRRHRKEKNEMTFRKIVTGNRSKGGPGRT